MTACALPNDTICIAQAQQRKQEHAHARTVEHLHPCITHTRPPEQPVTRVRPKCMERRRSFSTCSLPAVMTTCAWLEMIMLLLAQQQSCCFCGCRENMCWVESWAGNQLSMAFMVYTATFHRHSNHNQRTCTGSWRVWA